jgi:hypothetical protein
MKTALPVADKALPELQSGVLDSFPDQAQVRGYADSAAAKFVQSNFSGGRRSGDTIVLAPQGNTTRAEIAVILYQVIASFDLIPE